MSKKSSAAKFSSDKSVHFIEVELKKKSELIPAKKIDQPEDIYELFQNLQRSDREKMIAVHLNKESRIVSAELVAVGNETSLIVSTATIFRAAVSVMASSVILVHNHPSGDPTPTPADIKLTKQLSDTNISLEIPIIDHIIIGDGCYTSLAELGYITK